MRLEQFDEGSPPGEAGAARAAPAREIPGTDEAARRAQAAIATHLGEAQAAAAAHRVAEAQAARLCDALGDALGGLRARIDGLTASWAEAVSDAARACLPSLAATGFAAEVADAALRIARRAELPHIRMRLAPAQAEAVAARLAGQAGAEALTIEPDPALPDGRVLLDWEDGGATIDRARLEQAAQAVLEHHLARLRPKDTPAEEPPHERN
ncbi:MAG: hypothetical protein RQ752_02655 [Thermohalobaculum sp.]|nr:hypothetical protein [Thermohalobaculum sp.]